MSEKTDLDIFLVGQPKRVHRSKKRLAKLVREAYPIGTPALIMKSSTDRLGESAGYSFYLGTPDEMLRLIASWLITEAGGNQVVLLGLVSDLWKRHGREDVALAGLLLANIDHNHLGIDPWDVLSKCINPSEAAEGILLSVEELYRAGQKPPKNDLVSSWCEGGAVQAHLALITIFVYFQRGFSIDDDLKGMLSRVVVPDGDSLLTRIKHRFSSS